MSKEPIAVTPRGAEMIGLIQKGHLTNRAIARNLSISNQTGKRVSPETANRIGKVLQRDGILTFSNISRNPADPWKYTLLDVEWIEVETKEVKQISIERNAVKKAAEGHIYECLNFYLYPRDAKKLVKLRKITDRDFKQLHEHARKSKRVPWTGRGYDIHTPYGVDNDSGSSIYWGSKMS